MISSRSAPAPGTRPHRTDPVRLVPPAAAVGIPHAVPHWPTCGPGSTDDDRRVVPQPARPRDGPVRGREVADSGAQSHPADSADGLGLRRRLHPRLRPARHDDAVRRPGHRHGTGVRAVPEAAPPQGVPVVPAPDRPGGAGGVGHPPGTGQLRDAQARHGQAVAGGATPASICTSRPPRRPG